MQILCIFALFKNTITVKRVLFILVLLAFTVPSWAFKVYIFADMEGATGITCRPQILNGEGAARKTKEALAKRHKIELLHPVYPAVMRTERVVQGSVRTFDPAYVYNPNPEIEEVSSPDSVEEVLLGKPKK